MPHKLSFLVFFLAASLYGNQRYSNFCTQGNKTVIVGGVSGAPKVQGSYPQCQVTVYLTGTLSLATIYSDNSSTPLANPFTANVNGSFFFYAANGRYDVTISGGGLPAPATFGDILLADPTGGGTTVSSITAGAGISASPSTGAVTVTNTWGAIPSGTQLQGLRIQPNTGNNTTLQFATPITVSATDYNFSAQTPGGSLAAGSNSITMTPCPLGMNGTDTLHYVYISGGTGTAEAGVITGGSCTAGATTGTVIVTLANTHTGAWTITSACGGVPEAIQTVSTAGGGTVMLSASTVTLYAQLSMPSNVALVGKGSSSIIRLVDNGWPPTTATGPFYNALVATLVAITTADHAVNVNFSDFTLDMNGATNHNLVQGGSALSVVNCDGNCVIEGINLIGMHSGGRAISGLANVGLGGLVIRRNTVRGYGGATPGSCGGGIFTQTPNTIVEDNYIDNLCDEALVANNTTDIVFMGNTVVANFATPLSNGGHQEDASRTSWIGNIFRGSLQTAIAAQPVDGPNKTDFVASGNLISCIGTYCPNNGIVAQRSGAFTQTRNVITNNVVTSNGGSGAGIWTPAADLNTITGNIVSGFSMGVYADSSGRSVIQNNQLVGNTTAISCLNCSNLALGPNQTDDLTEMATVFQGFLTLANGANQNVSTSGPVGGGVTLSSNSIYLRITGPTGAFSIGGLTGGYLGKIIYLVNPTGQTMTINNNDAGSTAANRISTVTGANVSPHAGSSAATLIYDTSTAAWILISTQ
jgi:parallel beta-helix repeat protein